MSDWFTYAEAAERFGISAEAVRQLAMRRKWPRRRPNDAPFGQVQVLIPTDEQIRPRPTVQRPDEQASDAPVEHPSNGRWPAESDALIERERDRADRADQRADEATRRAEAADADRRAAIALADQSVTLLAEASVRADRAEAAIAAERSRGDDLRARIDVLNAEMVVAQAEADRQLAEERLRADRLGEQVEVGHREVDATRAEVETLRAELTVAQHDAQAGQQAAAELRRAETTRKARGLMGRLRAAWRGE